MYKAAVISVWEAGDTVGDSWSGSHDGYLLEWATGMAAHTDSKVKADRASAINVKHIALMNYT